MKKVKKILALVLAMTMALGMTLVSSATGTAPSENDGATATVKNVENNATVTAYQIVDAVYDNGVFTGYKVVEAVKNANLDINDLDAPTAKEITDIAQALNGETPINLDEEVLSTKTLNNETKLYNYSAELTVGTWLVLVTGTVKEVYNPMIVSVCYEVDGTVAGGNVDANSDWKVADQVIYAKSTAPTITKTMTDANQKDVAIGDVIDYEIKTTIPSYSAEYTSAKVIVTDTLSKGLTLDNENFTVKSGDEALDTTAYTKTVSSSDAEGNTGFVITFHSAWVLANGGKEVTITYKATVNTNAEVNFDPNTNEAELEYSNNPTNSDETETTDSKTYSYTFAIGANVTMQQGFADKRTDVVQKIDEDGNILSTTKNETTGEVKYLKVGSPAKFRLTKLVVEEGDVVNEAFMRNESNNDSSFSAMEQSTDAEGGLTFTGLDEGTYKLVEIEAPSGFALVDTPHKVVITPTYVQDGNNKGMLKSLTITIDDKKTSTYTATYEGENITKIDGTTDVTTITNTKLASLPSTGGIGTTIFTIGGVVLMVGAAGLFFATRKRSAK